MRRVWIVFCLLISTALACNLVSIKNEGVFPPSEVTPADTTGWVSYEGNGVSIGAPAVSWTKVPLEIGVEFEDPSVDKVYQYLLDNFFGRSDYRLVMMKTDGTAWLVVQTVRLDGGQTLQDAIRSYEAELVGRGQAPINQRSLMLSTGEAARMETAWSPNGSQIVHRQFRYITAFDGSLYYLTFTSQYVDFVANTPVFEAMALSFWVNR